MKKFSLIIISIISIFIIVFNGSITKGVSQENISSKLIRFHVIANSDSDEDQKLKLKVRDEIIAYLQPKLNNSKSKEESKKILLENDYKVKEIASNVIKKNGYKYSIESSISKENFPVKTYGNITLPAGKYDAYRVIIGKGEGQNWWCVMFPPICFVDITKGKVSYKETEAQMKKVLTKDEFGYVDNQNTKDIKIKLKIVEIFTNLKKVSH